MVYTYQRERLDHTGKIVLLLVAALGVVVCGGLFVTALMYAVDPGWEGPVKFAGDERWEGAITAAVVLFVAAMMFEGWRRRCDEIRLSDDGTCELELKRGVIQLHATEISAVDYKSGTDETSESYTLRYRGRKTVVTGLEDLPDFIARLQSLNPAVDLSSFPTAWPDHEAAPEHVRADRSVGRAVFAAVVVGFVALIAWHTLS